MLICDAVEASMQFVLKTKITQENEWPPGQKNEATVEVNKQAHKQKKLQFLHIK